MLKKSGPTWRLGQILVQQGWITWAQLVKALEIQRKHNIVPDDSLLEKSLLTKKHGQLLQLGELLIQMGCLEWNQLKEALRIQQESGRKIGEILVYRGFVSQKDLFRALAVQFNKVYIDFEKITVPQEIVKLIPKEFACKHRIMPLVEKNGVLLVATSIPEQQDMENELRVIVRNYEICTGLACPEEIDQALTTYYGTE